MGGHVAICIVGYANAHEVVACLGALEGATHRDFEIVVCENGGERAFAALQAALPPRLSGGQAVRAIAEPDNPGFAGGVNACLAATPDADAWWVLNPDTAPEPEALAAMLARLHAGDAAIVGSTLYGEDRVVQCYGGRWVAPLSRAEMMGGGAALSDPVDAAAVERAMSYIIGASMLVGREFLARTGPMREDYFLYCEEVEWCLRGRARGLKLGFAPDARVLHYQGTTTGSSTDPRRRSWLNVYLNERNKLLLVRDTAPAALLTAVPAAFALLLLRYARFGAWRQFGYGVAGWFAALRGERGKPPRLAGSAKAGATLAS